MSLLEENGLLMRVSQKVRSLAHSCGRRDSVALLHLLLLRIRHLASLRRYGLAEARVESERFVL